MLNTKQTESKNSGIKSGDWVIMQDSVGSLWMNDLDFGVAYQVKDIKVENDYFGVPQRSYLIEETYYQPDEVKKVTPEDDPEYFI